MRLQQHKSWNEIKTNDSWAIFKIMGEFVDGFEKMSKIGPCVSIFGSARTKTDDKNYKLAVDIAKAIVNSGYGVITGGGPGIMEALHIWLCCRRRVFSFQKNGPRSSGSLHV